MLLFRNFYKEIKERKIRKWLAIYTSISLTTIGIVHLLSMRYKLPSIIFDSLLIFITCGFPAIFISAWVHGKKGFTKFKKSEMLLYSILFLAAVFLSFKVSRSTPEEILQPSGKSIAVLPFENLSNSTEDEFFTNGIMEDILTNLSKISDLNVVSRTSVMQYKNTKKKLREIAEELGVENILEGSVRRLGTTVRITSQLIDAKNDRHIWAETYDRDIEHIFEIQSEVAQQIAGALMAKLSLEEKLRIDKKSTDNFEAYSYYLRGREYYNLYTNEDNERAIDLFNKAIELDKKYALAYAGLADAYAQRRQRFGYGEEWMDSSVSLSKKAISFDPNIAEPYKSLGLAYAVHGWYSKALIEYYKAVEMNPNYAPAVTNIGGLNAWLGKYDEAYKWWRKSLILQPGRASNHRAFGYLYTCLVNDSLAEYWYKKTLELQPDYTYGVTELTKLYLMKGDLSAAKDMIFSALRKSEEDVSLLSTAGDVELFSNNLKEAKKYYLKVFEKLSIDEGPGTELGYLLYNENKNKAEKYFKEKIDLDMNNINSGNEDFSYPYDLARIYSVMGNKTEAFKWLRKAINSGWHFYRWCQKDPLLENLREEIQFKKLMSDLILDVSDMKKKVEQLQKS